MYTFKAFFTNYVLMSTISAWFLAQFLKMVTTLVKEKQFKPGLMLFSSGGMPSSHSASVCSLCTATAISGGFGTVAFAITAVVAMVVITDAMGVRWETGEQSKVINKIVRKLFAGNPEDAETALKELVGHTPFQVLMGCVVGVAVPFLMLLVF
jgi:acid phosphatase family membrane protein YuiD